MRLAAVPTIARMAEPKVVVSVKPAAISSEPVSVVAAPSVPEPVHRSSTFQPASQANTPVAKQSVPRLLEHYRVFVANLTHVTEAMRNCIAKAQEILSNYEGISRNVPLTLVPLIENMNLISQQIDQAALEMRENEANYSVNSPNADGRGTWRQVLRILLRVVGECNVQLGVLPHIPEHESAKDNILRRYTQSHVLPVLCLNTEYLKTLATIWPTLMLVTLHPQAITDAEAKTLIANFYTHPFWYDVRINVYFPFPHYVLDLSCCHSPLCHGQILCVFQRPPVPN